MDEPSRTLEQDITEIAGIIGEATDDADELIRKPLRQTFRNHGKLLRPSLMVWAAGCGTCRQRRKLLMAGAAVELLHTASLIHDDIIDDGQIRRGLPAVHSLFGNSVAVYTGDFTIIRSYKLLHDSGNDDLIYDFILATEKLCKSDIVQYQNRGNELAEKDYIRIAAGKTGALFALSMKIGARLGGLKESVCERFGELGETFGVAFQINDDCLDYRMDGSVNKSTLSDLRQGIYNLPLILALQKDDGALRALLASELTEETLLAISEKVVELGGIDAARERVKQYLAKCRKLLNALPGTSSGAYFSNLLNRMEEQQT